MRRTEAQASSLLQQADLFKEGKEHPHIQINRQGDE